MNRSLANVILGGYSITRKEVEEQGEALEHQTTDIAGAVDAITNARSVIIVPGYGLAVASAQYAIADLVKTLTSKDIKVRLAAVTAVTAVTACCAPTLCQVCRGRGLPRPRGFSILLDDVCGVSLGAVIASPVLTAARQTCCSELCM